MATCKDCLHYDACYIVTVYGDDDNENCKQFKNKADVAEVKHAYWKTVTETKNNTVCGDGVQIQKKVCSNCEQPMGVCGNDYCGHCGAIMDAKLREENIITHHKYADEVIRAFKLCFAPKGTNATCAKCPYHKHGKLCKIERDRDALDLINRQRSKIKALEMDNAQLQSDIINANQNSDHIKGLWEAEKEKVEKAKQKVINVCKMLKNARAEAIKEFAERLKALAYQSTDWSHGEHPIVVEVDDIDELVEEIAGGDQNGNNKST